MRLICLATAVLALGVAACGEDERPASTADPDQPVQAPADPGGPVATPAPPRECRRVSRRLTGRSLWAARATVVEAGCALRVVIEDGRHLIVTDDFNRSRINVRVDDDRVTDVRGLF